MRGAQKTPALMSYRDAVTELVRAGEPFGDIEEAIDEVDDLSRDQKASLWLFAFSLRERAEEQFAPRPHLVAVQ
jgi:hypothetical protein